MTMTKLFIKIKTSFEAYTMIITVKFNNEMEEQKCHKYINNNKIHFFLHVCTVLTMVVDSVFFHIKLCVHR